MDSGNNSRGLMKSDIPVDDDKLMGNIQNESETEGNPKSFENVLVAMGGPGRYQIMQALMLMSFALPMSFLSVKFVFLALEPQFTCSHGNETELILNNFPNMSSDNTRFYRASYDKSCEIDIQKNVSGRWEMVKSIGCTDGYDYVGGKDVSFITEWDLVCDQTGIPQLAQSVIAFGAFLGVVILLPLADKFGRWTITISSLVLMVIIDVGATYSPDIYSFVVLRFFAGILFSGLISSFVLAFEMFNSRDRVIYSIVSSIAWSFCVLFLCGTAYAFRHESWRYFQLCTAIVSLTPLLYCYFIDESPSWLHSVGKKSRAEKIIMNACRINGVNYDGVVKEAFETCFQDIIERKTKYDSAEEDASNGTVKSYSVVDLFTHKRLLAILVIGFFASFTSELTYTGLYLTASTLVGNFYLNVAILSMSGIPAYVINYILLSFKGRKVSIIGFTLLTATSLLISTCMVFNDGDAMTSGDISLVFFVLGKCANVASYTTLAMYIPECFPTSVRTSAQGIAMSGTSVGGMVAPYLVPLYDIAKWAPGMFLVCCGFLTAILFVPLPETRGKQLTTTIDYVESENVDENNKESVTVAVISDGGQQSFISKL